MFAIKSGYESILCPMIVPISEIVLCTISAYTSYSCVSISSIKYTMYNKCIGVILCNRDAYQMILFTVKSYNINLVQQQVHSTDTLGDNKCVYACPCTDSFPFRTTRMVSIVQINFHVKGKKHIPDIPCTFKFRN